MILKESFVDIFQEVINDHYDDNYISRKAKEIEYFKEIVNIMYSNCYWRRYTGRFKGNYLNKKHLEYTKKGFYNELYIKILQKYINLNGYYIFKFISTDTCFIPNKYCSNLGRNTFYKGKKGLKISSINDANGIPLSLLVLNGNIHDSKLFFETYAKLKIKTKANKYKKSNRHKQYFLADKGYDSNKIIKMLNQKGYTPIIPQNKRNIKDKSKLRTLNSQEKKIYKKRIIVENYYSWISQYCKLIKVFEKSMESYLGLLLIASSIITFNRIDLMCV